MRRVQLNKRHRILMRWWLFSLGAIVLTYILILEFSNRQEKEVPAAHAAIDGLTSVLTKDVSKEEVPIHFKEVSRSVGINFHHMPTPRRSLLPEDMGSGVACGDFDSDGYPDLFFINYADQTKASLTSESEKARCQLFRNASGKRFDDVTDIAGVGFVGAGMGAAWGDYDNDHDLDLYVTANGNNVLYENQGDGSFLDVTTKTGVQDSRFSTGCSWCDYDKDGDLDLYVCNYVTFSHGENASIESSIQHPYEQPFTLNPSSYKAQRNALFRNNGDGTFDETGVNAGVADPNSKSLSASWVDIDNDGWSDLYVANDVSKNDVFRNKRDGTFEDIGMASLSADYRGAMGIGAADFDNDLDQDLFITHWIAQENALYQNMKISSSPLGTTTGKLWFLDAADQFGLGQSSLDMIGWATGFSDFNNDGLRDLWVVNGSTFEDSEDHSLLLPQKPVIYWNRSEDGFVDVARYASADLAHPLVGRGGATLDFNRDGAMDLVIVSHGGRALLFQNVSKSCGNWLKIKLHQTENNMYAVGGRAYVTAGDTTQMGEVGASSSYLSQDESVLHFGIGTADKIDLIRIVWPDGEVVTLHDLSINQELTYHRERRSR